jgi:hypothetical protein
MIQPRTPFTIHCAEMFGDISDRSIFVRRLGALSAEDQKAVRDCWNQHMRL